MRTTSQQIRGSAGGLENKDSVWKPILDVKDTPKRCEVLSEFIDVSDRDNVL